MGGGALIAIVLAIALPLSLSSKNNSLDYSGPQTSSPLKYENEVKIFNAKTKKEKIDSYNNAITKTTQDNILKYWFNFNSDVMTHSLFPKYLITNWVTTQTEFIFAYSSVVLAFYNDYLANKLAVNFNYFLKLNNDKFSSIESNSPAGVSAEFQYTYRISCISQNNIQNINLEYDNENNLSLNIYLLNNDNSFFVNNVGTPNFSTSRKLKVSLNALYLGSSFETIVQNIGK